MRRPSMRRPSMRRTLVAIYDCKIRRPSMRRTLIALPPCAECQCFHHHSHSVIDVATSSIPSRENCSHKKHLCESRSTLFECAARPHTGHATSARGVGLGDCYTHARAGTSPGDPQPPTAPLLGAPSVQNRYGPLWPRPHHYNAIKT